MVTHKAIIDEHKFLSDARWCGLARCSMPHTVQARVGGLRMSEWEVLGGRGHLPGMNTLHAHLTPQAFASYLVQIYFDLLDLLAPA